MEIYTLNLDSNNYVLSIGHTKDDSIALAKYDLTNLSCYRYMDGELILDEAKLSKIKSLEERDKLVEERAELELWLKDHDYIGIKISTGRATIGDYATEIAEMSEKASRINEIDRELSSIN